jgi:hypothetical protein
MSFWYPSFFSSSASGVDISWNGYTKPPTCMGAVSFTTSISVCRSIARCMARRTRTSASGFFFIFIQTAWITLWLKAAALTPCIAFALRQDTGSRSRA